MGSGGFRWIPVGSDGFRWILMEARWVLWGARWLHLVFQKAVRDSLLGKFVFSRILGFFATRLEAGRGRCGKARSPGARHSRWMQGTVGGKA